MVDFLKQSACFAFSLKDDRTLLGIPSTPLGLRPPAPSFLFVFFFPFPFLPFFPLDWGVDLLPAAEVVGVEDWSSSKRT